MMLLRNCEETMTSLQIAGCNGESLTFLLFMKSPLDGGYFSFIKLI